MEALQNGVLAPSRYPYSVLSAVWDLAKLLLIWIRTKFIDVVKFNLLLAQFVQGRVCILLKIKIVDSSSREPISEFHTVLPASWHSSQAQAGWYSTFLFQRDGSMHWSRIVHYTSRWFNCSQTLVVTGPCWLRPVWRSIKQATVWKLYLVEQWLCSRIYKPVFFQKKL